jgi:hypothetical protein
VETRLSTAESHHDAVWADSLAAHVVEVAVISCLDSKSATHLVPFYSKREDCGLGTVEAATDLAVESLGLEHHP